MADFDKIDQVVENDLRNSGMKYGLEFRLVPSDMLKKDWVIPSLTWESIQYNKGDKNNIPDDKKGIYAFAIRHCSDVLPPHLYILYVGIAGIGDKSSLRSRYESYLNTGEVLGRAKITKMISLWRDVLVFLFAPIEDKTSNSQLEKLEEQINDALRPPMSQKDYTSNIRRGKRAF
ncbi:MAG: hypothetical protein OXF42_03035 [Candidatus Dadabacteria bacterium]|nr:hypothetical protein [Candidatus Dadabacteria bacterium]